mgnify:CR=1 FL=1
MSSESEQTTKTLDVSSNNSISKKEKDPKKVAAGKTLSEYNTKAKEALTHETKRDGVRADNKSGESLTVLYVNDISFGTVQPIVAVGFVAVVFF